MRNLFNSSLMRVTILIGLIIIGLWFRFSAGGNRLLWQDEAETTINSLQVIEVGYPNDTYQGKPLFENISSISSNDPKYAYESTNYYGTKYERNKGWLTYWYQALFLKAFGFSTFVARLPFVLLFVGSLLLIWRIGKRLFDNKTGLIAGALFTINPFGIAFEYQARYYALVIFLSLAGLLYIYRAVQDRKWRDYFATTIVLIAIFYTHIIACVAMTVFFLLVHAFADRSIRSVFTKKTLVVLASLIITSLPWIILVKFWTIIKIVSDMNSKLLWIVLVICIFFSMLLLRYMLKFLVNTRLNLLTFTAQNYILWFLGCIFIIKPLLSPSESIGMRLVLEVNAILIILVASILTRCCKQKQVKRNVFALIGIVVVMVLVNNFRLIHKDGFVTNWIHLSLDKLDELKVDPKTPVFVTYQQFPFMLYGQYNVELAWPIRREYYDSYPGPMIFILHEPVMYGNSYLVLPVNGQKSKEFPFINRISNCAQTTIDQKTTLVNCPALKTERSND